MPIRCVQCCLSGLYISFFSLDPPCPLEYFPEDIEPAIHRYTNIDCDEVVAIESLFLAWKRVEAIEQNNYGEEAEAEPGGIRLEARSEDECITANALSAQSTVEFDVCNRDGHPGQDGGDCC